MARGSPDWKPWQTIQRFSEVGGAVPYEQKITTSSSADGVTPATSTQDIVMEKGFVSHVWIRFPQGPVGLYSIAIFDAATQLWPGAAGSFFTGDNEVIAFDVEYDVPLVLAQYKLTIHGSNLDDAYEHSALVRIWVVKLPA